MLFPMAPHISAELSSRLETHEKSRGRLEGQSTEEESVLTGVGNGHCSWPQLSKIELALLEQSLSRLPVVVQLKGQKLGVLEVETQVAGERDALVQAVMDSALGRKAMSEGGAGATDTIEHVKREPKRVVVVDKTKQQGGFFLVNIVP